jgi:hypothetical protein
MNQLVLRDKAQEYMFRFLGGLTLLGVGLQLFNHSPKKAVFWILVGVFILAAVLFFTMLLGTLINRLTADRGILTIRWHTKIFKKHLRIDQIAEITDDRRYIRIIMKDGRTVRLPVRLMESDKRNAARRFLKENTGL